MNNRKLDKHIIRSQSIRYLLMILSVLLLTLSAVSFYLGFTSAATSPAHYVFNITARQFAYEPGRIVVNLGDVVTFNLKSDDVTHGFYIDGYGVNETVSFGEEKTITIIADKPGKFKIRCSITCGPLHPFMVGEFIVEQNGVNFLFIGSVSLIALVGVLTFMLTARRLR